MKKLYIFALIGLFLIGIVGAVVSTSFTKDATIDKETKDTLSSEGITSAVYKATYCNEDYCEYCGSSSTGYGLGCVKVENKVCIEYSKQKLNPDGTPTDEPVVCLEWKIYTDKEKQDIQAIKVEEKLKEIASDISKDKAKSAIDSLGDGVYTIKEKK